MKSPEEIALAVAELASDRKAVDIVQLDLRGLTSVADYFLICTGRSDRQVKAIHDGIHLGMKNEHGTLPTRVDGVTQAQWILMDYGDVIVHVFTPEMREFYRLEQLWGEAPAQDLRVRRRLKSSPGRLERNQPVAHGHGLRALTGASARPASCGSSRREARACCRSGLDAERPRHRADITGHQQVGALVEHVGDHQHVEHDALT